MDSSIYLDNLDHLLNLEDFQTVQDQISKLTGFAVITADYTGKPVTKHSNCTKFCTMIRNNSSFNNLCEKCDARGGLEAARTNKPYIYLCHMGIIDLAVPIIVNNHYLGAIMAGQVFLDDTRGAEELEKMLFEEKRLKILDYNEELRIAYKKLPKYSYKQIKTLSDTIFTLIDYRIKSFSRISTFIQNEMSGLSFKKNQYGKRIDVRRLQSQSGRIKENINIYPAVKQINDNIRANFSIEELADLCNLSTGYFSKQFHKNTGYTIPQYINNVKIEESCKLLEITDMQINEIAYNLGFEDSGYFNKVFKGITGITPKKYRENYRVNIINI